MKPTDALFSKFILVQNSTRFEQFLYPSSGVSYCTFGTGTCYTCSVLILQASCRQTCITRASAECTVANSWWLVEELPQTCRVLYKNKFGNECVCWFHLKVTCYDARSYERIMVIFVYWDIRNITKLKSGTELKKSLCRLRKKWWSMLELILKQQTWGWGLNTNTSCCWRHVRLRTG